MTLPTSSQAEANNKTTPDAPLVFAGRALAERGQFGLVWIDEELVVTGRYGPLVSFAEIGERVSDEIPALIGLEKDIEALRTREKAVLELPAIAMISDHDAKPTRLNLLFLWIEDQRSFLCLAMPTGIGSEIELELAREMRRRLIAETELKAKTQALARANQDLEDYASVIAHDLKAPMRAMRYQIDDLEKSLPTEDRDEVRDQLGRLRGQARRMSDMLTALFAYSSAGRKFDVACEVDTDQLIRSIVASVRPNNQGEIRITGSWPSFVTLDQPLDVVLRNLIDNAIKHHTDPDTLEIVVHGMDHGDRFEFTVTDNGPGIAEKHGAAIFLPFRTLAPADADDVRGLGLALVHRHVAAIGGKVTIRERPDGKKGAVFHVIWPKQPD